MKPDVLLKAMFQAAVDAALPEICVPAHLPPKPKGRTIIIGAGKASGAMAKALEDAWGGPLEGLVVTRYGYRVPTERLEVVEAAHPVPDAAGREAAKRIFHMVQGLTQDDLVLCLISGGGSALLALPPEGSHARRQAGGQQGAAQVRRHHLRDEHGAEAPLGHQRRPARCCRLPRQGGRSDDLRRAGRRSLHHRLGPDRCRPVHQRAGARHHREIQDRRAEGGDRSLAQSRGDAEARRQAARACREHHDRHPASLARSRRRGCAQRRRDAGDPRRFDRRRVARRGAGPCRYCAAMQIARPAREAALRADLGRRDHDHAQGQRQRRPQHRVPAGTRHRSRRHARHLCPCRRHRRRRRERGQCRRSDLSRHARARGEGRGQRQGDARRQRSLDLLQRDRRSAW